jgi:hypothetical protein
LRESEWPPPGVVDVATRRVSVAAAWESAMDLPPEGTTVESTAAAWAAGDDKIWIGAGRGASGVDLTRSNDASSSS